MPVDPYYPGPLPATPVQPPIPVPLAPRTEALREVLAASSFSDPEQRGRVRDLLQLEAFVADGAWGLAGNMRFAQLRQEHPAETLRFRAELKEGRTLTAEEATRELADLTARIASREAAEREATGVEQRAAEVRALEAWLSAGGRP